MPGGWKHYEMCCSLELYSIPKASSGENKNFKALQEKIVVATKKKS